MKVFISYSSADSKFVDKMSAHLKEYVEPLFWDKDKIPGEEDWKTIFNWIDQSSLVLVVITDSTVKRSFSVGQEIGFAHKAEKVIVPFISKTVSVSDVGFLKGVTPIYFDEFDPNDAIEELRKSLKIKKEKKESSEAITFLAVCGIILYLLRGK